MLGLKLNPRDPELLEDLKAELFGEELNALLALHGPEDDEVSQADREGNAARPRFWMRHVEAWHGVIVLGLIVA